MVGSRDANRTKCYASGMPMPDLIALFSDKKRRDLALMAGGMVGIMSGAKLAPLGMFAVGAKGLEEAWRERHPEFDGDLKARWDLAIAYYDQTHQHPVNRTLHTVGIPMILGGAIGMLASPRYTPPWFVSNASWTAGWILNFVGHGFFEKGAPAFAEDPLSFIAGPAWDLMRLTGRLEKRAAHEESDESGPTAVRA